MFTIINRKRIFILVMGMFLIISAGCESIGLNPALRESVRAGSEICRENILFQSPDIGKMYGIKWIKGKIESLSGQFRYEYDLIDAPPGLTYRFMPRFKQTRVDRGYIIETEYEASHDFCFASSADVEPGTYEITVEVNFFDQMNDEPIAILHIPYQLTVEPAGN